MPAKFSVQSYRKKELVFEFPFTYPSLNQVNRMGWRARKKAHDEFQEQVGKHLLAHEIKFDGKVKIYIDLFFKKKQRRDKDNYTQKWLLDCLVKRGILKDDSSDVIPEVADIEFFEGEDKTVVKVVALNQNSANGGL